MSISERRVLGFSFSTPGLAEQAHSPLRRWRKALSGNGFGWLTNAASVAFSSRPTGFPTFVTDDLRRISSNHNVRHRCELNFFHPPRIHHVNPSPQNSDLISHSILPPPLIDLISLLTSAPPMFTPAGFPVIHVSMSEISFDGDSLRALAHHERTGSRSMYKCLRTAPLLLLRAELNQKL